MPTIQIFNAQGQGVPGKVPQLSVLDGDGNTLLENLGSIFLNSTKMNSEFEASDKDGMIRLYLQY